MSNSIVREDILKELFNISVGKAASILSEIINKKIVLNVPDLKIQDLASEKFESHDYLPKVLEGALMVSSISFKEQLTGKANLIFPAEKMRSFISLCINENPEDSCANCDFTDIDFDIIKEIGNIILNSLIGEIGNFLNIQLNYSLPEVRVFDKIDFTRIFENKEYNYILILFITFKIDASEIVGAIIIDLTFSSLNEIFKKIDMLEDSYVG